LDQFTDQFNAAVAQRINVVSRLLGIIEADNLRDDCDEIFHLQGAMSGIIWRIKAKALIKLEATNPRRIVATIIEESMFDHILGIFNCGEITRT
jgi:hypothetical protein